ncbi:MAG: hypothetical protein IJU16_00615 [Clostridia bacterium]|nr:hypothetical protein [Clostridia bacterium]
MMDLFEKIAYLKGLLEGLDIDPNSKEGKIYAAIADVFGEIADEIADLGDFVDEMSEQVDEIDEDLADLEEDVYEDFEDDDYDEDDEWDGDFYEVTCPACGESFEVDEETLFEEDGIACPNCNHPISFDVEEEENENDE